MHRTERSVPWRFDTNTCTVPPLIYIYIIWMDGWIDYLELIWKSNRSITEVSEVTPLLNIMSFIFTESLLLGQHKWQQPLEMRQSWAEFHFMQMSCNVMHTVCQESVSKAAWQVKNNSAFKNATESHWVKCPYTAQTKPIRPVNMPL